MDGLNKGEAAGFALILNGDEEDLWGDSGLIGRRTARRVKLLSDLKAKVAPR